MSSTPLAAVEAPPVYRLEQVTKRHARGDSAFTLEIPELAVGRGEFCAFVGASGCGKSTLLDLLGLISRPAESRRFDFYLRADVPESMAFASEERLAAVRRHHLGYVLQAGGLLPFLTVAENILLPRRLNGLRATMADIEPLATRLGIQDQLRKKPAALSGGQRQRAAIARALAHEPLLVLADEPTGAVDKLTAQAIRDLFETLARELGATVLLVTHDESLVANHARRVFTFELRRAGNEGVVSRVVETSWAERAGR